MKKYITYLLAVLRHKYYVFKAGRRLGGIPTLRLIIHDWQKFLPVEFGSYADYFYGGEKTAANKQAFMYAWLHHIHYGPHHWEYWLLNPQYNFSTAINGKAPMPAVYVREMIADWLGASRAYTGGWDMTAWLDAHLNNILDNLHPKSVKLLLEMLTEQGYGDIIEKYDNRN